MRYWLTVFTILFGSASFSQDVTVPTKEGAVHYEIIDSTAGTKEVLYGKAKAWLAKTANSAKDVIQLDDLANGKLIGKAFFKIGSGGMLTSAVWPCNFIVTIDCRNDKCRLQLSEFTYGEGKFSMDVVYADYKKGKHKSAYGPMLLGMNNQANDLLNSFVKAMGVKDDF